MSHLRFRGNRSLAVGAVLAFAAMFASFARAEEALQVHEWGTFTALQDEDGKALPGINIDDEPLPRFCHDLCPWALVRANAVPAVQMKGVPQRHPYVTLRLETPVIYFHPSAAQREPFDIDVQVTFRGGWLTEFYPQAQPDEPGLKENAFDFGVITPNTVGGLTWRGVRVGTAQAGPPTHEHVWLAPRDVEAANVSSPQQSKHDTAAESERFLFYRGVGNRPVPLRVRTDIAANQIHLFAQCGDVLSVNENCRIDKLWLVDVGGKGEAAFRTLAPITLTQDGTTELASAASSFDATDYSAARMQDLHHEMHAALVQGGLNADEATAMLETWRRAYFQSPGLRLFFLVPRRWTDAVLPLTLSRPAQIHRLMMGRIELISPAQRRLLARLSTMTISDGQWMRKFHDSDATRRFYEGRSDFGDLGVPIPGDYQTYLELGRFRNALVLAEQNAHPSAQLKQFITTYNLEMSAPPQ